MITLLLRAASAAACTAVNGGASTISTSAMSFTITRNSLTYFTVSATVLYIFQLPAMMGVRMSGLRQHGHARQRAAAEPFERRATAGGDVRDPVGDARLLHRRNRVAAADDRRAAHGGHGVRHGNRAAGELIDLEHTHRPVPHHGVRTLQG